ncbi:MAG: pseudouridine synthase [Gammaproteobacteria bacterium RIFCSPHIGHO2_12_FULL_63_22]|nr:MAG: pseudouridine synthase [Gammaproteobacteria bacterium RIFCSPHIGHO2_12_FULL_63_22]
MQSKFVSRPKTLPPRHGLARVISKLGIGSRSQAAAWIADGRVRVNGRLVTDAEFPVRQGIDRIEIEGSQAARGERIVLMLNKPRGLVTTRADEKGRDTVYSCLDGADFGWLAPVGRLDKASEGLLLFSNDPEWAAAITSPDSGPEKIYHVQVDRIPEASLLDALVAGVEADGERLSARSATLLRQGERNSWLEIVLDEGRNRQIRRLLQAFDVRVLRLLRIGIGPLRLGKLAKGAWRRLQPDEIESLPGPGAQQALPRP